MSSSSAIATPAENQSRTRIQVAAALACLAVIMVAAALRLHQLGARSFWMDEGMSAAYMRMDWYNLLRLFWRREGNGAFYFVVLRVWHLFGASEAWFRGLSVLTGVATVPVLYAAGKRMFGTAAGLTAATLLAVNAYHVRYSQEARTYSMVMFLATLAAYFLLRAVEDGRRRDWNLYIAACSLAVYTHFFGVLIVPAHWVALKYAYPDGAEVRSEFKRALKLIGLWTLPVWIFIASTGTGVVSWIKRPGFADLYAMLEQYSGNAGLGLLAIYAVSWLLAALAAVLTWRRRGRSRESWHYALALSWMVVPVFITFAFSMIKPTFLPRFLIIVLPAMLLTAAAGITFGPRKWTSIPAIALIVFFAWGGVRSYYQADFDLTRQDYRDAAHYIVEQARPGDAILFHPGSGRWGYQYYADRFVATAARTETGPAGGGAGATKTLPMIVFPGHGEGMTFRDFIGKVSPQVLDSVTRDYPRVWVVFSLYSEPGVEDDFEQQIKTAIAARYRMVEERHFNGINVYLYAP